MKTFRINSVIPGWITISGGHIVSCSAIYAWAIHLRYEVLTNWLSKKGKVELVRL